MLPLVASQLRVRAITCQIENEECPDELIQSLQPLQGSSLLFSKHESSISNLQSNYNLTSYSKQLPNTLHLTFSGLPNEALLRIDDHEYLLHSDGALEESTEATQNTTIFEVPAAGIDSDNRRVKDAQLVTHVLEWNTSLEQIRSEPERVIFNDQVVILKLNAGLQAIANLNESTTASQRLAIILEHAEVASIDTSIREIDLRFRLPVLRTGYTF